MNASGNGSSRREFLRTSSLATGGLMIAFTVPGAQRFAFAEPAPATTAGAPAFAFNAFLRIGTDDSVTVFLAHSEMGQGIWTALPMMIAEELDADWSKVRVEHARAAKPYAHTAFGMQMTGGSSSTYSELDRYRQAGATARALLVAAAAQRFGVGPADCRTENGEVFAGEHRARYGELAAAASQLPAPEKVALKDPKSWRILGKPTKRLDTPEKITGQAIFGMDVRFDGLLTALVARPPVFGAKVRSFDGSAALQVLGVRKVVQVPTGVAVVADHFWAAKLGRDALKVDWDRGALAEHDSDRFQAELARLAATPGLPAAQAGDVEAALGRAAKTLEAEYSVPYLAHASMEPLNCTVRLSPEKCEVWTGTQFQTGDQMAAARIAGLEPNQVEIHTTFLGGGFGRRANPVNDFVGEAVEIAKAAGAAVKTVWTREDDTRGGYYRPAYVHRARIGLDGAGRPIAWRHVLAGQAILAGTPFEAMMVKDGIDETSVEGVAGSPYLADLADYRVGLHSPRPGIPVLWWRSVGNSHTAFVMESLIDEIAHASGKDPVALRRELLQTHPRTRGVLELAAERAGWGSPLSPGRSRGVAVHKSFGSYVAQVAEVSISDGRLRVHRVTCAIDCGVVVNPAGVQAQMESGIVFGLSAALYGKLTWRGGEVVESNFHDYRVLRIAEMPAIDVHIVTSAEKSGGVGEPGTPPIAPAVANAVFALTGQRLRTLPLQLAS